MHMTRGVVRAVSFPMSIQCIAYRAGADNKRWLNLRKRSFYTVNKYQSIEMDRFIVCPLLLRLENNYIYRRKIMRRINHKYYPGVTLFKATELPLRREFTKASSTGRLIPFNIVSTHCFKRILPLSTHLVI